MHNIVSTDKFIWQEFDLACYLYECFDADKDAILNFNLEGMCLHRNGLYRMLDNFCLKTGYDPRRITIKTANMIETHAVYNIDKIPEYWYEVGEINKWARNKTINVCNVPDKHFGNFIGRSSWHRLWIASLLDYKFGDKTIQTYHSGIRSNYVTKADTGLYDNLGLEDLVDEQCDIMPQVIDFVMTCPRKNEEDLAAIRNMKYYIPQNDFYPIQHPANLDILKEYNNIFVDVICETRVAGNVFFVTEKTWRCILARRPFIIMGSRNFLSNLKKLGFKTFDQFWREDYDEYGMQHRVKAIEEVLDIIATWPTEILHAKLMDMQDVLDHNYNTFTALTYSKIKDIFNE